MIIALQPDLVIGLDSQKEIAAQLEQLSIKFLGVADFFPGLDGHPVGEAGQIDRLAVGGH